MGPEQPCPGPDDSLLLLRLDDLAALRRAVGGRRLGVPLSLAGVLSRAGMAPTRAAAVPLAGVDPVADHLIAAGLFVGPGGDGAGQEQRRSRGGNEKTLRVHQSSFGCWWLFDAATPVGVSAHRRAKRCRMRGTRRTEAWPSARAAAGIDASPAPTRAACRAAAMAERSAPSCASPATTSSSARSSNR